MVKSEIPSGGEESAAFLAVMVTRAFCVVVLQLFRLAKEQSAFLAVPVGMFVRVVFVEKTGIKEKRPTGLAEMVSCTSVVVIHQISWGAKHHVAFPAIPVGMDRRAMILQHFYSRIVRFADATVVVGVAGSIMVHQFFYAAKENLAVFAVVVEGAADVVLLAGRDGHKFALAGMADDVATGREAVLLESVFVSESTVAPTAMSHDNLYS